MEGASEAALDSPLCDETWRLDASKDLLLSDVHLGRAKSDAVGLHTTVLTFRSSPVGAARLHAPAGVAIEGLRHVSGIDCDRDHAFVRL